MPNVATFDEFVNALTSIDTGDVINVTADLDANTWIPSYLTTFPLKCPSDGHQVENVVINGNGHTVYNINNSNAVTDGLFKFFVLTGATHPDCITINNLNFLNCACFSEQKPIFNCNSQTNLSYGSISFNDCTIQGVFNGAFTRGNFWYNRCMITIKSQRGTFTAGVDNYNPVLNQCWIYLDNISKIINTSVLRNLIQCYVKGVVNYAALSAASALAIATNCDNSCINVDADVTGFSFDVPLSTLIVPQSIESKLTIANTDKIVGASASVRDNIVGVSDTQMRDANYLFNIGFDILPT